MHRAQILIEEWQYDTLRGEAERKGKSISELVREILSDRYHRSPRRPALAGITGLVADANTAGRDHDVYLYGRKRR